MKQKLSMNNKLENRRALNNTTNITLTAQANQFQPPQDNASPVNRSSGSPTQSLSNIQKINNRLRARNPVMMSMTAQNHMMLPVNNRSLSPSSYQQLNTLQSPQERPSAINNSQPMVTQTIQQNANHGPHSFSQNLVKPTKHGQGNPSSRDFTHQRKIIHKSINSTGQVKQGQNQSLDAHMISYDPRAKPASSGIDRSGGAHHQGLSMSNHMLSQRQQTGLHDSIQSDRNGEGGIAVNKKFSQARKRNTREKSYDLYNQKLQLPPMLKPNHDGMGGNQMTSRGAGKQDRTYSLPSAGQVHQSMPLSPHGMQVTTPKSPTQRQVYNENGANNGPQMNSNRQPQEMSSSRYNNFQQQMREKSQQQAQQISNAAHKKSASTGANLNSMKQFFSARGQNSRGGEKSIEPLVNKSGIQNPMRQSGQNNAALNGVFSPPRRQINAGQQQQNQMQYGALRNNKQRENSNGPLSNQSISETQRHGKTSLTPLDAAPVMNTRRANPLTPNSGRPGPQQSSSNDAQYDANSRQSTSAESNDQPPKQQNSVRNEAPRSISPESNSVDDPNIQFVEVQTLLFGENPPVLNPKSIVLKNHEPTKASVKKCGLIKSYAANTNQGIIREYNEDRVSIILNILKPKSKSNYNGVWPQICFFGVFDGHGGAACADYLRDNLHNFVVQNELFPQHPKEAITAGFKECEKNFINLVEIAQQRAQAQNPGQQVGPERSGSCASVVMIIDDTAYVINVGDSRTIMSLDAGSQVAVLSRDHKPDDEGERIRVQNAGGKIYRTQTFAKAATHPGEKDLYVQGPLRVFPGRLSVSRTFGDIEAKRPKYGGNPLGIVCEPEIKSFKLQDNFDFFFIGCDGIFERLDNKQVCEAIWDRIASQCQLKQYDNLSPQTSSHRNKKQRGQFFYDEHIGAAEAVEISLREAAASRSLDNITVLILGLKNLKKTIKKLYEGIPLQQIRHQIQQEQRHVKNTYAQDFECLEVNEADLLIFSDDVNSANDSMEADHVAVPADDKGKSTKQQNSPDKHSTKVAASGSKRA